MAVAGEEKVACSAHMRQATHDLNSVRVTNDIIAIRLGNGVRDRTTVPVL